MSKKKAAKKPAAKAKAKAKAAKSKKRFIHIEFTDDEVDFNVSKVSPDELKIAIFGLTKEANRLGLLKVWTEQMEQKKQSSKAEG